MFSGIGEMVCWVITCVVFSENLSLVPSTCVGQPRTTPTHIHVNKNKILKNEEIIPYGSMYVVVSVVCMQLYVCVHMCSFGRECQRPGVSVGCLPLSLSVFVCLIFGTVFLTELGAHQLARLAIR